MKIIEIPPEPDEQQFTARLHEIAEQLMTTLITSGLRAPRLAESFS